MKQVTRNKMDTNAVVYKSTFLTVRFDEQGLELTPWRARPLRIDWHEVDFVYPLPMLERGSDGWREQANPFSPKGFRSMLKSTGRLKLYVIVNDRRPIIARTTDRLTHNYISRQLRPMADADGRLLEDQSDLCLDLRLKRLGGSITPLMDLVTKHSRIGLLLLDWIE